MYQVGSTWAQPFDARELRKFCLWYILKSIAELNASRRSFCFIHILRLLLYVFDQNFYLQGGTIGKPTGVFISVPLSTAHECVFKKTVNLVL